MSRSDDNNNKIRYRLPAVGNRHYFHLLFIFFPFFALADTSQPGYIQPDRRLFYFILFFFLKKRKENRKAQEKETNQSSRAGLDQYAAPGHLFTIGPGVYGIQLVKHRCDTSGPSYTAGFAAIAEP